MTVVAWTFHSRLFRRWFRFPFVWIVRCRRWTRRPGLFYVLQIFLWTASFRVNTEIVAWSTVRRILWRFLTCVRHAIFSMWRSCPGYVLKVYYWWRTFLWLAFRKQFVGKAYLKINLLVTTPLHRRSMEVGRSGLWAPGISQSEPPYPHPPLRPPSPYGRGICGEFSVIWRAKGPQVSGTLKIFARRGVDRGVFQRGGLGGTGQFTFSLQSDQQWNSFFLVCFSNFDLHFQTDFTSN